MTWWLLENINTYSTIGANFTTIIVWMGWLLTVFYFFWNKKHKAIIVSSKTFQVPIEKEDIVSAIWPKKILDETIGIEYDKNQCSPKDFCEQNTQLLSEIKGKYNPICVFWIAEMYIFFWIGYYLQDSIHINWFRKLKEDLVKFSWNPWSWTWLLSLKWPLFFKWWYKSCFNRYETTWIESVSWNEIVLIINISYGTNPGEIPTELRSLPIIKFWIKNPDSSFLINEWQVKVFAKKIKTLMHQLDQKLGTNWKIHIFWNLPVPFCIKLWQSVHRSGPESIFYELNRVNRQYIPMISTKDITV